MGNEYSKMELFQRVSEQLYNELKNDSELGWIFDYSKYPDSIKRMYNEDQILRFVDSTISYHIDNVIHEFGTADKFFIRKYGGFKDTKTIRDSPEYLEIKRRIMRTFTAKFGIIFD